MDYSNYQYNVGKVRNYDNFIGFIVANDGEYMFNSENILENEEIIQNDIVMFRGEEIQGKKIAFFIKKLSLDKPLEESLKKHLKKFNKENE